MAIVYPLAAPPSPNPVSVEISRDEVVDVTESPFSLQQRAQSFGGQRWRMSLTLPRMHYLQAMEWTGFVTALRGQYGTFRSDPGWIRPRGSAAQLAGAPVVAANPVLGRVLSIAGAPANDAGYLKRGDFVGLGGRLYQVLTPSVDTGAAGNANIDIWPSLRSLPLAGASVAVSGATTTWRLASGGQRWTIDDHLHFRISIPAVEAL